MLKQHGVDTKDKLVLKLKKSLYGLKQAGRLWSELLHAKLVAVGFIRCLTDIRSKTTIIGVYVDDLLVTASKAILVSDFLDKWEHLLK